MPRCPCEKPYTGNRGHYYCEMLGCDMFPHFCEKFLSDARVQDRYFNGVGAMQIVKMKVEDAPKTVKKKLQPICGKAEDPYDASDLEFAIKLCITCGECERRPDTYGCCPQRLW